jgi:hypothetical protein
MAFTLQRLGAPVALSTLKSLRGASFKKKMIEVSDLVLYKNVESISAYDCLEREAEPRFTGATS